METEEVISAFSSMSLSPGGENGGDPNLSWKGLSAEKGLLRTVSLKNRARPKLTDRRPSLHDELKGIAGIVKKNSFKRKGSKKKKGTTNDKQVDLY